MELKERNFQISLTGQLIRGIKTPIITVLNSIAAKLDSINSKVFTVKVDNFPKSKDYTDELKGIKQEINRLPGILDKIANKQFPTFDPLVSAIVKIETKIGSLKFPEPKEVSFVEVLKELKAVKQAIQGIDIPQPEKTDVSGVLDGLDALNKSIKSIKLPEFKQEKVDFSELLKAIGGLQSILTKQQSQSVTLDTKNLETLLKEVKKAVTDIKMGEFPTAIEVTNFPPQKIPQPVTNININPLRGSAKTTAITVTTSATALPTSPLSNRRTLIIYNNDAGSTLYIGGSDVTTNNGFPVSPQSYSPPVDAGPKMIIYGIASTSISTRVLEVSNDAIGG